MYGGVSKAQSASNGFERSFIDEDDEYLSKTLGPNHWRVRGYHFLHQHGVVLSLTALLVIDLLLLLSVLAIEIAFPGCPVIEYHCLCEGKSPADVCLESCKDEPPFVEQTIDVLEDISLCVLVLFLVEVCFHVLCIGVKRIHRFLAFDAIILLVSLVLEVYMSNATSAQAITIPLLVLSRSWRLVRIGHGAFKDAHDAAAEEINELKREVAQLKLLASQGTRYSF